jgi:catechol 2,3-dioxygenase-like lactoylglutathione lyase family enzyme
MTINNFVNQVKSIRPFIGSKNYEKSRAFYNDLGFKEVVIEPKMSLFIVKENLAFYLQNAYVKDWIENTMIFLEIENAETFYEELKNKNLTEKYKDVRLSHIKKWDWGKEIHLLDPAGILWHFGNFNK